MPKTKLGKWAIGLILTMLMLFFIGTSFTNSLYTSVPSSNSIFEDMIRRPALVFPLLTAMLSGVAAFVTGIIAVAKDKERAPLVYIALIIGACVILFLAGESLFPH